MKKFFEKLKSNKNFSEAGKGRTLSGSSNQKQEKKHEASKKVPSRQNPSEGVQRAGAAALARIEANQLKNKNPNWSLSAIRAQAKKELEQESLNPKTEVTTGPKKVCLDGPEVLTVSGVYFHCPLIGPEVLPKDEMAVKIRDFLHQQLEIEDESALSACLIIHTCNPDKTKIQTGIETLIKYLKNIIENPGEEKFRKIRLENKVFKEKVLSLDGTVDFLLGAGFEKVSMKVGEDEKEETFLVYPEEKLENVEFLNSLIDALQNAEPIKPELDRNVQVLMPTQALAKISLPKDFFNLTVDEIKREQERKTAEVELNSALRTKAMRERDAVKELRKYRFTLIRIRFSDGIILQGTFKVTERLSAIINFITENLIEPERQFHLLSPGGEKLNEIDATLNDLRLIPAALITLVWDTDGTEEAYLLPELMALLSTL